MRSFLVLMPWVAIDNVNSHENGRKPIHQKFAACVFASGLKPTISRTRCSSHQHGINTQETINLIYCETDACTHTHTHASTRTHSHTHTEWEELFEFFLMQRELLGRKSIIFIRFHLLCFGAVCYRLTPSAPHCWHTTDGQNQLG